MEPTLRATTQADAGPQKRISDPDGQWVFEYDRSQVPLRSSGRKSVYSGTFSDRSTPKGLPCRALVFGPDCSGDYGRECATLGMLSAIGAGPRFLATSAMPMQDGAAPANVIFEEDAGSALANVIGGQSECGERGTLLHEPGTREREAENDKIFFDVFAQICNVHDAGFFHRDLRCENVCVRRFGPRPADIKATVIDFELSSGLLAGAPSARAPLFDVLFHQVPSHLAGDEVFIVPTSLELDMAYLAALSYHLARGKMLLSKANISDAVMDDFVKYLEDNVTYFGYPQYISPVFCRRLEHERDIDPLAQKLGLIPVNASFFPTSELMAQARSLHRPYLDAEDLHRVEESPAGKLHAMVRELAYAVFESYKDRRKEQGLPIEYELWGDQPKDLRDSNYAQVAHIPKKIEALGFAIMPMTECPAELRVTGFSETQIETLARMEHGRWAEERIAQGWTSGPRDPEAKTTPYLVPYEELDDEVKEYDRDAVRQVLPLLERAGFAVARPGRA